MNSNYRIVPSEPRVIRTGQPGSSVTLGWADNAYDATAFLNELRILERRAAGISASTQPASIAGYLRSSCDEKFLRSLHHLVGQELQLRGTSAFVITPTTPPTPPAMSQDTIITVDKPFSFRGVTNYAELGKTLDRVGKTVESFHDWKDKTGIGLRADRPCYISAIAWPTEFSENGRAGHAGVTVGIYLEDGTSVSVGFSMQQLAHLDGPNNNAFIVGEISKALEVNADTVERQARFAGYAFNTLLSPSTTTPSSSEA